MFDDKGNVLIGPRFVKFFERDSIREA